VLIRWTGMRGGEVRALRVEHIMLDRNLLLLRDNQETGHKIKGRIERTLPIVEPLAEFLAMDLASRTNKERYYLGDGQGGPFYRSVDSLTRGISKALTECGIEGVKPLHGLRGTVLTELSRAGVDVVKIQKIAGHREITTTRRYINADTLEIADALATLSNRE